MLLTLKHKGFRGPLLSICIGLLLIFGSQYSAYRSVKNLSEKNVQLNTTTRILHQTANFGQRAKDLQLNMYNYLNSDNEALLRDNYLKRVELIGISDTLFNLVRNDPQQTYRVKELLDISSKIALFTHRIITVSEKQGIDQARAVIREGEGIALNKRLVNKIKEIERFENLDLENRRKLVVSTQNHSTIFIAGTTIVGFLLTLAAFIFMVRDQRKQRQMQAEINKTERHLKHYVEAIPDGMMVINAKKEIVLLNQSGKELLSVENGQYDTLDNLLQKVKFFNPNESDSLIEPELLAIMKALQGEKIAGNKLNLMVDGKVRNIESNVSPIFESNGEVSSAITVFRDITDRVNYQTMLENARSLAEQSLKVKDVFLSNVSHEIRTPLNAIIGFSNMLESEETDPKHREYVGNIQLASRNLLGLINDLLDFSKIEAGHVQIEKTATSLSGLIDSVSVLIGQRAREKGITYEVKLSPEIPNIIETDHLRLTQILLNVCGNAVKFTEKGSVTLFVEPVTLIENQMQWIRFRIVDTGIGIAENKIKDIFERFVQASDSTTRLFGGTGLGLSIVKSLVELLHGTIKVTSIPNVGTTFSIECPFQILSDDAYEKVDHQLDTPLAKLPNLKILVAEDNLLNQKLLTAIFERMNLDFTITNNGLEAINALKNNIFDLIVMDLQMPVMDGYTAIKHIRKEISTTIPIITMTAHALVGEKEDCLRIGANSYISKPFKQKELIATILQVTGQSPIYDQEIPSAPNEPAPQKTMLNLNYFHEITGGSSELRKELVTMFETESEVQLAKIRQGLAGKQVDDLVKAIHKYRSSLFSVGMLATAESYKALEADLKNNIWKDDLYALLPGLEAEVRQGLTELKALA